MRLAVVSGLMLALAAVANAAVREEPLPAEPLSDDGSARTTLLRGEDIVDLVNEAALARAPTSSAAPSTCASGFRDLTALAAAACPGGTATRTVDWDAYDDAYAAALARLPDEFLRAPRGCTFGCLPLKTTDPSPLERVASVLPWRGKCFLPARGDELVREPTLGDGAPDERPVRLLARVLNRVATPPSAVEPAVARGTSPPDPDQGSGSNPPPQHVEATESRLAPAALYVGESSHDGAPALVVDYRGQSDFGAFRDELRHVGCGVWLGKTYLAGDPGDVARSLATVGNVTLSPVVEAVVERAMRDLKTVPGAPLPHVLNFVLFQTPPNETETETETNPERDRDEDGQP